MHKCETRPDSEEKRPTSEEKRPSGAVEADPLKRPGVTPRGQVMRTLAEYYTRSLLPYVGLFCLPYGQVMRTLAEYSNRSLLACVGLFCLPCGQVMRTLTEYYTRSLLPYVGLFCLPCVQVMRTLTDWRAPPDLGGVRVCDVSRESIFGRMFGTKLCVYVHMCRCVDV